MEYDIEMVSYTRQRGDTSKAQGVFAFRRARLSGEMPSRSVFNNWPNVLTAYQVGDVLHSTTFPIMEMQVVQAMHLTFKSVHSISLR